MATYGDFSSLLQLGVGIGIGLSLFRAPVDLWTARLEKAFDAELRALRGTAITGFRQKKRQALQGLRLRYFGAVRTAGKQLLPFMVAAATGAVVNLASLIWVSLSFNADPGGWSYFFIFISSIYYIILLIALTVFALAHFGEISTRLKEIQYSTEHRILFKD